MRYLKWLFRPSVLIVVSILLVAAAGFVVLPIDGAVGKPLPLPLASGEQEIAWLYPATSAAGWERLAMAVQQARDRLEPLYPGLELEHDYGGRGGEPGSSAGWTRRLFGEPASSATITPQIALTFPGGNTRLVFRWYKLTSQWTPEAWADALVARKRPPLAIIGGNNSYWARELAIQIARVAPRLSEATRPLLLFTTATADRVPGLGTHGDDTDPEILGGGIREDGQTVPLTSIYAGRSFRFCFTNRQMATAVTRFIWSRPELQPESDPAYLVQWTDDAYSRDLFAGYRRVLDHRASDNVLQQWAWVSGGIGLGVPPVVLTSWYTSAFRNEAPSPLIVDSSVGSFSAPNPYEAKAVRDLLAQVPPGQPLARRLLLVITGQQQPSRRFLRDLARSAPDTSRRFVVAMGDAISFNTIYRDRQVTWPIQDLPFPLVFFCHRNPIDERAGFRPSGEAGQDRPLSSGTEDLLLYRDIVEALSLAFQRPGPGGRTCENAVALARGLRELRISDRGLRIVEDDPADSSPPRLEIPLFGPDGQRNGGTGEHVVYLRPRYRGSRVLPEATIEVWLRQGDRTWQRYGRPLRVSFDEFEVHDVK